MQQSTIARKCIRTRYTVLKITYEFLPFRMFADTCLMRSGADTQRKRGIERDKKTPLQIAFMGDSRMRQVYQALVRILDTGLGPGLQFL